MGPYIGLSGNEASRRYDLPLDRVLVKTNTPVLDTLPHLKDVPANADPQEILRLQIAAKKEEIRLYFHNTFELYEQVFDCIAHDDGFYVRPIHKLRHPMIFYFGHTATFYINKLSVAGLTHRIDFSVEEKCAIGVDEMSWDDLNEDLHFDWPSVNDVVAYRQKVRDHVDQLIRETPLTLPVTFSEGNMRKSFYWILLMGCEHERIHVETAAVHIRELPLQYVVQQHPFWRPNLEGAVFEAGKTPKNEMIDIEAGNVSLGRQFGSAAYGWDSDYSNGTHVFNIDRFKASKFLVSNEDYIGFIEAKGYATREFWDDEGWSWVQWKNPKHPWFWVVGGGGGGGGGAGTAYKLRVQTEEIPLPLNWPVEVNHLEAKAFSNWRNAAAQSATPQPTTTIRLPTEAEWTLLRDRYVPGDQFNWEKAPGNVNFEYGASSLPIDRFLQGPLYDIVGNVWQHTETPVYPFPGFKSHPVYDDFSLPTFDGRHFCQKGGTWVSTGNEATRDARYAFRRHFFQYIGIRLVEGEPVNEMVHLTSVLGLDPMVDAATAAAYRPIDAQFSVLAQSNPAIHASKPVAVAELAVQVLKEAIPGVPADQLKKVKVLDLFCGAGRSTFELTSVFDSVTGVDFTARLLQPGFALKERGEYNFSTVSHADHRVAQVVKTSTFGWDATRDNAQFFQSDPTNLHDHLAGFDLIICWGGALERAYNPSLVPGHLTSRLNTGGIVIFISSFDFAVEFADKGNWLSGTASNDNRDPVEELQKLVAAAAETQGVHFKKIHSSKLTSLRQANGRKAELEVDDVVAFLKVPQAS